MKGQNRSGRPAVSGLPRILVLDLVELKQYSTTGTQTYAYYVVTDPDFEELGPFIEDIQATAELRDPTAQFRITVIGQKSFRGDSWEAFEGAALIAELSAADPLVIGNVFATRTDLGAPRIRVVVGVKSNSGSAFDNGVFSLKLTVKFWS